MRDRAHENRCRAGFDDEIARHSAMRRVIAQNPAAAVDEEKNRKFFRDAGGAD